MDRLTGESQKRNRKLSTLQAIEPCDSKTVPTAEIDSRSSPYQFFTVDSKLARARSPSVRNGVFQVGVSPLTEAEQVRVTQKPTKLALTVFYPLRAST
jgi:hypothetical protein